MTIKRKKPEQVLSGMEIDESLDMHEKAWKIQPIAWLLIGLFVLSGLLGLYGTGPLSKASKTSGGVKVEYERFFRYGASMKLDVRHSDHLTITEIKFPADYISSFQIQSIIPEPSGTELGKGTMIYKFDSKSPISRVVFNIEPRDPGMAEGSIEVNGEKIFLSHLIYP